ncbi:GEM-like protein 5 [Impatiens glandulifera]|uniref:GEM-like protein 5 n=1 Tax=Impatiens glandulifera TaxID=253017 RepID=UPI001FB07C38|nr:GEM-like protein 5 [Impatiens glandulifera]
MSKNPTDPHFHYPSPSSGDQIPVTSSSAAAPPPPPPNETWGTHVMGTPAVPTAHPANQKAAFWSAGDQNQNQQQHNPYLHYSPVQKPPSSSSGSGTGNSPMECILQKFNTWGKKTEITANNIWHNLKTGPSVSTAAWDKLNLNAKAITGGGFEVLYKQTFDTLPNEKLKKTFACYLSTSTGPVAGTLYLSNLHLAFCSDRPLSFTTPSRQESWSYYKIMVPLSKISMINPVVMRDNQSERYLQIMTNDGHDFWFMGFVNFEKAARHISESLAGFSAAPGFAGPPHLHP